MSMEGSQTRVMTNANKKEEEVVEEAFTFEVFLECFAHPDSSKKFTKPKFLVHKYQSTSNLITTLFIIHHLVTIIIVSIIKSIHPNLNPHSNLVIFKEDAVSCFFLLQLNCSSGPLSALCNC
jgi:hypothetical protein